MGHMNTDLVRTTGFRAQAQARMNTEVLHNAIVRHRWFPHRVHRHMSAFSWVTANRFFYRTASGHVANGYRFVFTGNFTQLQ